MSFYENVVIDDIRNFKNPNVSAVMLRTSNDATAWFERNPTARVLSIWLDFDLGIVGGVPDTAAKVADYLCERAFNSNPVNVGTIYVHTSNPVGRAQMSTGLRTYGYRVVLVDAGEYFAA